MSKEPDLQIALDAACRAAGVPGAALAILDHEEIQTVEVGVASVETREPVTPATRFPIWSIAKSLTTMLVLQLVDEGRLALDDPAVHYFPELSLGGWSAALSGAITIRHLLACTSGLPQIASEMGREGDDALERYLLECRGVELVHVPGERFAYSNTGFTLAGLIVERLRGHTWDEVLFERLLQPLGLAATGSRLEQLGSARLVANHDTPEHGVPTIVPQWRPRDLGPAGTVVFSTATDMASYAAHHLRSEWGRMREPQVSFPGPHVESWGLGWALYGWGASVFGWDGGGPSRAFLRVLPEHQAAVVLLTNASTGRRVYHSLLADLLRQRFGVHMAPEAPPAVDHAARPGELARYTGIYRSGPFSHHVSVSEHGELLVRGQFLGDEELPLLPTGERDVFILPNSDYPTVVFDGDFMNLYCYGYRRS